MIDIFKLTKFALVLTSLMLVGNAKADQQIKQGPEGAAAEAYLRNEMAARKIPGMQVAVVQHGKICFLGAYGETDLESGQAVDPQTLFSINSATKSFTGVAVMQLVEAGKLDLNAPVSAYLADLPESWRSVTVMQLLTHISGMPDVIDVTTSKPIGAGGFEAAWAQVQTLPMDCPTGTRYRYNQTNYVLLGKIIEKLSGHSFMDNASAHQFKVVGMPRTCFGDGDDNVPGRAKAYRFDHGELKPSHDSFAPELRTAAGLNSTAEEVAHWIMALQKGQLLQKQSLKTMWQPSHFNDGQPTSWALGWPTIPRSEHRAVAGIGGMRSAFYVYPDDDLAVVILTSLAGAAPETMCDALAGFFLPDLRRVAGSGYFAYQLRQDLQEKGYAKLEELVQAAQEQNPYFQLEENELNSWGYRLLGQKQASDAVAIFKLNVRLYPRSANVYDSLADGYESLGERQQAADNYQRSLELDPGNDHARERLKVLGI